MYFANEASRNTHISLDGEVSVFLVRRRDYFGTKRKNHSRDQRLGQEKRKRGEIILLLFIFQRSNSNCLFLASAILILTSAAVSGFLASFSF